MNNVAFDVVIGLVFIYLLYSLYATVFIEIITTLFNLRAKNLYYAIARMLKDEKEIHRPWKFWVELFTTITRFWGTAINLKNPELYKKFINQPTIKYQTSGGLGNKPSYLTAESFSKALIDSVKVDNPDTSVLASIEQGLELMPEDSETKKHIRSLLDDANSDIVKFRILVENWYNETQDRAAGWFKQTTQFMLVIIGTALVVAFNVDTLAIIKKLSRDKDARNSLVQMAVSYSEKHPQNPLPGGANGGANADAEKNEKNDKEKNEAKIDSLRKELESDIANSQTILASNWPIGDKVYYSGDKADSLPPDFVDMNYVVEERKGKNEKVKRNVYVQVHKSVDQEALGAVLCNEASVNESSTKKGEIGVNALCYKLRYIFLGGRVWGYVLTVIAIAIGSPFWFDLLNKLIKLRSSNAVSSDNTANGTSDKALENRGTLNRVG